MIIHGIFKKDGMALKKDGVLFIRETERDLGGMGSKTVDVGSAPSFSGTRIARVKNRKSLKNHADIRDLEKTNPASGLGRKRVR